MVLNMLHNNSAVHFCSIGNLFFALIATLFCSSCNC